MSAENILPLNLNSLNVSDDKPATDVDLKSGLQWNGGHVKCILARRSDSTVHKSFQAGRWTNVKGDVQVKCLLQEINVWFPLPVTPLRNSSCRLTVLWTPSPSSDRFSCTIYCRSYIFGDCCYINVIVWRIWGSVKENSRWGIRSNNGNKNHIRSHVSAGIAQSV